MPADVVMSKIEETLAHQQQEIQDLNEMVTRQWDEIDMLKKQFLRLKNKIDGIESDNHGGSQIPANQKPPHY